MAAACELRTIASEMLDARPQTSSVCDGIPGSRPRVCLCSRCSRSSRCSLRRRSRSRLRLRCLLLSLFLRSRLRLHCLLPSHPGLRLRLLRRHLMSRRRQVEQRQLCGVQWVKKGLILGECGLCKELLVCFNRRRALAPWGLHIPQIANLSHQHRQKADCLTAEEKPRKSLEITESRMSRPTTAVERLSALNVGDSTVCTLHHPHAYPLPQNTLPRSLLKQPSESTRLEA